MAFGSVMNLSNWVSVVAFHVQMASYTLLVTCSPSPSVNCSARVGMSGYNRLFNSLMSVVALSSTFSP